MEGFERFVKFGVIGVVVLAIVGIFGIVMLVNKCTDAISEELDRATEIVGKNVNLSGDTLLIINFSPLENKYELENGLKISNDLAREILIIAE